MHQPQPRRLNVEARHKFVKLYEGQELPRERQQSVAHQANTRVHIDLLDPAELAAGTNHCLSNLATILVQNTGPPTQIPSSTSLNRRQSTRKQKAAAINVNEFCQVYRLEQKLITDICLRLNVRLFIQHQIRL